LGAQGAWSAPAAEVVSIEGKGEVREAQQGTWRSAAPKQQLFPTNFVRTLDMSRMAILFADRTQVRLAPNSLLQIKEVASDKGTRTILNLNQGRSWGQAKAPPRDLSIETPAAVAAIRGTDWEITVDGEGRATLAVFSGEVRFHNEQGSVLVAANEQASAERGKAPVKLVLRTSRDRIQWVSSFTVDPRRYREFRSEAPPEGLREIAREVADGRLAEARERLARLEARGEGGAVATLLLADFDLYRGELPAAARVLDRGAARFPSDERFDVARARLAMLDDRNADARRFIEAALSKRPDSVDALVALGDLERHEGRGRRALDAYARATDAAAKDPRGWQGLGIVEAERENIRRARSHLERAIALEPNEAAAHAELGTLEGIANDPARAREALRRALALQPDNYVALTGLAIVELRAGDREAALEALTKATLIEPRYARAHLYLAATYYQLENERAALETLARAAELDPNDPLPHLLASIIHLDRIDPVRAAEEARLALARIPFAKSLNAIADNQKGVANVGAPLAIMGLEAWARSAAQESYLPFWAGSHLFLADRYPGAFNRRSELMQGFITDPLVFGASNRFQSLVPQPGHHATAAVRYNTSDDTRLIEPAVTLNGHANASVPFSYFAEWIETRIEPRNNDTDADARTLTVALGVKPAHEIGVFLYANRLSADVNLGRPNVLGDFIRIDGTVSRVDGGIRYAPDAFTSLWIKAGAGDEDSRLDQVRSIILPNQSQFRDSAFRLEPRGRDAAIRFTRVVDDRLEWSLGAEASRQRTGISQQQDSRFHFAGVLPPQEYLSQTDRDKARALHAIVRWSMPTWRLEAGVAAHEYRKERDILVVRDLFPNQDVRFLELLKSRDVDPMLGVVWRFAPPALVRAACRRWLKPIAPDTLAPVAIAGVPLDDQLVFAGGRIEQCRVQGEWTISERTFAAAHVERSRTRNLLSGIEGAVLNTRTDLTNVDRLRNRLLPPPPRPDLLEDVPIYAEGIVRRANLAVERIVTRTLAARLHYSYTESENTDPLLPERYEIPYLARHQANVGLSWTPGRNFRLTAQAVHRSKRFADESNRIPLPAGWDAQFSAFVESGDKHWAVEIYGAQLLKKLDSDIFGIVASYRF
jgi:tetratricopeptide (TPR) repeat protein